MIIKTKEGTVKVSGTESDLSSFAELKRSIISKLRETGLPTDTKEHFIFLKRSKPMEGEEIFIDEYGEACEEKNSAKTMQQWFYHDLYMFVQKQTEDAYSLKCRFDLISRIGHEYDRECGNEYEFDVVISRESK